MNQSSAFAFCNRLGSTLVKIDDLDELIFLNKNLTGFWVI